MQTELLPVNPEHPEPALIARAARVIRAGGLVAFPTETVYGLGAHALDAAAVARIFTAKERPATNPVIVHVADAASVGPVVAAWPEAAQRLADRFWPGPLTLVLPRGAAVPDTVTAGGPTVALRVPAHPVARALLEAAAVPIAAPSANRANRLSPTRAEHVWRDLNGRVDMILDGGPAAGGVESTVLDLTAAPRLLRPGLVTPAALEAVIGPVIRGAAPGAGGPLRSPGMLARHYAPRAPLECASGGRSRVEALGRAGLTVGWLAFPGEDTAPLPGLVVTVMPAEPTAYAAQFYASLHALDDAGVARIVVTLPPATEDWLMIHDRLRRASTPER